MNNVINMENYQKGKKRREMVELLSEIEEYLDILNDAVDDMNSFISTHEDPLIFNKMMEILSFEEKRNIQKSFKKLEFQIKIIKNQILLKQRRKPSLF